MNSLAQVVLGEEGDQKRTEDTRVDTNTQETKLSYKQQEFRKKGAKRFRITCRLEKENSKSESGHPRSSNS